MVFEFCLFILIIMLTIFMIVENHKRNAKKINIVQGDPFDTGIFCLRENYKLGYILWVCFGGFAIILVIAIFSLVWQGVTMENIVCLIGFLAFCLVDLIMVLKIRNWEVNVKKYDVRYKNLFGQVKEYNFKDLKVKLKKNGNVFVYYKDKKAFVIDTSIPDYGLMIWWASKYGVFKD